MEDKHILLIEVKNNVVSKSYLLWVLGQEPILDYLQIFSRGSVIRNIPVRSILELEIPLRRKKIGAVKSIDVKSTGIYKQTIENYLISEYERCKEQHLYLSAIVMAGAISEALLMQLMVDSKIKVEHLKNKTMGRLIEFARIEGIIQNDLLDDFQKISEFRNHIHPNKLTSGNVDIAYTSKETFKIFDRIVKMLGI